MKGVSPLKMVVLIRWQASKREERRAELEAKGYRVSLLWNAPPKILTEVKSLQPGAVLLDLSRSPAKGRDLAVALRINHGTRRIPLIFVDGAGEKVGRIREVLPDAFFTSWEDVLATLEEALARPPEDPVVPSSILAGYAGTPLPKKLGIKEGASVLLVRPPEGIEDLLSGLPEGVSFRRRYRPGVDLILWFIRSAAELNRDIGTWAARVEKGGMWILWPKKSSAISSDLTQARVRKAGLSNGLVDFKIAAVDDTWSGLKFSVRRKLG